LTCRNVIEFLMAYLDGELPAAQRAAFERHLSVCPSCVNYLATYREAVRLGRTAFGNLAPASPAQGAVPEGLVRAILAARRERA
jgi:anti-sigma factor RsiW